jgi:hypothetical protein
MQVLGNATVHQADLFRTLAYGLAAVIGSFLLLQAAAGTWRRAALLLLTLPLTCVGAVLIAPLVDGIHSAGAIAGVFAVLCLAVRAGVQLVRRTAELEREQDWPLGDAALAAARERAIPLMRTTVTTAVVLVPAVVLGGRAGLEMLRPFAVTVLGGLVTMTIVTLVVLPALDLATGPHRRPRDQQQTPRIPGARTGGGDVPARAGMFSKGLGRMKMKRSIVAALAVIPLLAGCAAATAESAADDSPVKLKAVKGTDRFQVSLTAGAEHRLGVATAEVRAAPAPAVAGATTVTSAIPYAAVIYDSDGSAWTYTRSRPHTYVRAAITVDRINGDLALLTAGPDVGTAVVVVGAPELLGAEMQIAGEE